jgi:hypothetical protein
MFTIPLLRERIRLQEQKQNDRADGNLVFRKRVPAGFAIRWRSPPWRPRHQRERERGHDAHRAEGENRLKSERCASVEVFVWGSGCGNTFLRDPTGGTGHFGRSNQNYETDASSADFFRIRFIRKLLPRFLIFDLDNRPQ